jgi:hypothetical protein
MTNAHNDVSETRNDILQELNNFHGNEINDGNVIEEENVEANSILVQGNNENNENKNLKCELRKIIGIFCSLKIIKIFKKFLIS